MAFAQWCGGGGVAVVVAACGSECERERERESESDSCRQPFKGDKRRVFAVGADLAHGKDVSFAVSHPDPAQGKGMPLPCVPSWGTRQSLILFLLLRNFCLISVSNIV